MRLSNQLLAIAILGATAAPFATQLHPNANEADNIQRSTPKPNSTPPHQHLQLATRRLPIKIAMARRKKDFLDDGSDSDASDQSGSENGFDSQEDDDSRAERRLFEHRRKRLRTMGNGKAAAWEGIFGEENPVGGGPRRPRGGRTRGGSERTDWTKYVWRKCTLT